MGYMLLKYEIGYWLLVIDYWLFVICLLQVHLKFTISGKPFCLFVAMIFQ